jgi:dienelactone hydrolase
MSDALGPSSLPAWHPAALAALDFPLGWRPGADPQTWRQRGRQAWLDCLIEPADPPDPVPRLIWTEQRSGYCLQEVELSLGPHRRGRIWLAKPKGPGPFPAVLLLHDHGAMFQIGKEKLIRPPAGHPKAELARVWMDKQYAGRALGDDLAAQGWVVAVADALGWGDRDCGAYENQQAVAANLFNLGSSWAGLIAAEDLAAAAWLAGLPEVDSARVGAMGHSMGGFRAMQLAALSPHISRAVAMGFLGTIAGLMQQGANRSRGQSAFATTHPGLSRRLDFPDLAALAAPKPLLMIHGQDDHLFPVELVQTAARRVAAVYQAFGEPDRFRSVLRPGGHVCGAEDQALARSWLAGDSGISS